MIADFTSEMMTSGRYCIKSLKVLKERKSHLTFLGSIFSIHISEAKQPVSITLDILDT